MSDAHWASDDYNLHGVVDMCFNHPSCYDRLSRKLLTAGFIQPLWLHEAVAACDLDFLPKPPLWDLGLGISGNRLGKGLAES
jgi:hypothetical protein